MAIDQAKLDALLHRFVLDLGATVHAANVVIGDKLGLYKTLAELGPSTPGELAGQTGIAERYLAEWLAGQAAGDRVEDNFNPVGRAFYGLSTLLCVPNSLSQQVGLALGAQAGEARLRAVATQAGSPGSAAPPRPPSTTSTRPDRSAWSGCAAGSVDRGATARLSWPPAPWALASLSSPRTLDPPGGYRSALRSRPLLGLRPRS